MTRIGDGTFYECTSLTSLYFKGNTPWVDIEVFEGANQAKVYCLPGTTGWEATLADRATELWRQPCPHILSLPPTFGIQNGGFGFRISWASNANVVVEASTNLIDPAWSPVSTNLLTMGAGPSTDGGSTFSDPDWTDYPNRIYRLRWEGAGSGVD